VLVLGPLFSEKARQLSHIEDDSELIARHGSRSSLESAKGSTELIIEGHRRPGYVTPPQLAGSAAPKPKPEGPKTRISIQLNNIYTVVESFEGEARNNGILKTVSVEVIEEDITEADRASLGGHSVDDDWQNILRGGPPTVSRSSSRASGRERA